MAGSKAFFSLSCRPFHFFKKRGFPLLTTVHTVPKGPPISRNSFSSGIGDFRRSDARSTHSVSKLPLSLLDPPHIFKWRKVRSSRIENNSHHSFQNQRHPSTPPSPPVMAFSPSSLTISEFWSLHQAHQSSDTVFFSYLLRPPAAAVHSFIPQVFHIKGMNYLGIIFLDLPVDHCITASVLGE